MILTTSTTRVQSSTRAERSPIVAAERSSIVAAYRRAFCRRAVAGRGATPSEHSWVLPTMPASRRTLYRLMAQDKDVTTTTVEDQPDPAKAESAKPKDPASQPAATQAEPNSYFFKGSETSVESGGPSLNNLSDQIKAWWTKLREEDRVGERGEGYVVAQGALIILIVFVPQQLEGVASALGLSTFFGGVILALFGVRELGDKITPLPEPIDGGQLITTGIYSLARHPMYGGLLLGALGLSAWTSDAERYLLTAVLFYVLNEKAAFEEALLQQKFPDYEEYKKNTKKFIPYIF